MMDLDEDKYEVDIFESSDITSPKFVVPMDLADYTSLKIGDTTNIPDVGICHVIDKVIGVGGKNDGLIVGMGRKKKVVVAKGKS